MRLKNKSTVVIGTLLTLLILISSVLSAVTVSSVKAAVTGSSSNWDEHAYSEYTDTDYLLGSDKKIDAYRDSTDDMALNLYKSTSNITDNSRLEASGDDPITKIVPKELFMQVGKQVIVGREYGFVIDTFLVDGGYHSIVMLFDIENKFNLLITGDHLVVRVTPLFQREYVYAAAAATSIKCHARTNSNDPTYGNYTNQIVFSHI